MEEDSPTVRGAKSAKQSMKRIRNKVSSYVLQVDINHAEGLKPNFSDEGSTRFYKVLGRVNGSRLVIETPWKVGIGEYEPKWGLVYSVPLREIPREDDCLFLEVVKIGDFEDPGTSSGLKVVGRVRIPLPNVVDGFTGGRCGLARFRDGNMVGEGHMVVQVKLVQENLRFLH